MGWFLFVLSGVFLALALNGDAMQATWGVAAVYCLVASIVYSTTKGV